MTTVPIPLAPVAPARFGLRTHLYALIAATLLPMLALGLLSLGVTAGRLHSESSQWLEDTAGILAQAVDQGLSDNMARLRWLEVLDTSTGDATSLQALWRAGRRNDSATRLLRTTEPAAARLLPPNWQALLANATEPKVSPLYFSDAMPGIPLIAILQPGLDGNPAQASALIQRSTHLLDAVAGAAASQRLLVALVDDTGRIVARSRNEDAFVGHPVPDWATLVGMQQAHGRFEARTQEGDPVMFAFHRLPSAPGWALVVGEPREAFVARWQRPLAGLALGGLLAILIALIVSRHLAHRLLAPLQALARRSVAVAEGSVHPPPDIPSTVREFAALQDSITQAEQALQQRADDARALAERLDRSQRLYRAVAEVGALVFWQANAEGEIQALTGWTELTGQRQVRALGRGWLQVVHPEDVDALALAWQRCVPGGQLLDFEFRVRSITRHWRWVRLRGVRVDVGRNDSWAGVLEDVDARRRAQEQISYLAHHDPLTGLANRAVLMGRLHELMTSGNLGSGAALLCLDLDRFKEVNDTLGHPKGDALLCAVAERLRAQVRRHDLIARLGGDEFVVLQLDAGQPEAASGLARRLLETLQASYDLDGMHAVVGVSIGIAIASQTPPERLLQHADLALYRAKEEGRGQFRFFEKAMDVRMQKRRQLELDLRRALAEEQFELHYQPLVDLRTRQVKGFEALLRWQHPERGLLLPEHFLPLLEDIGLIRPLGRWVLRQACQDASGWPEHLTVAVNLAPSQLDDELDAWVLAQLDAMQFPPQRLELELREIALAQASGGLESLRRLQQQGVAIVMDDFGTGDSSIGCLRRFPFDKVKIDRSFVQELGAQVDSSAVISAVTHLCTQLGIATVIEGVETASQYDLLGDAACDEAQGYFFGHPMRKAAVEAHVSGSGGQRLPAM